MMSDPLVKYYSVFISTTGYI